MSTYLDPDTQDIAHTSRAYRAFARAQRLQPGLEAFARALTNNSKLNLRMGGFGASFTDGKNIWITPPMELGDQHPHMRSLCDRYDEIGHPLCEACRVMEGLMRTAVHEIAHIVERSFDLPTQAEMTEVIDLASQGLVEAYRNSDKTALAGLSEDDWRYKIRQAVERARQSPENAAAQRDPLGSYIALSRFVSPWLPALVNVLEDARVNAGIHKTRPGTVRYFKASVIDTFEEGILTESGERQYFRDRPPNVQLPTAALTVASGYDDHLDLAEYFDPAVAELVSDPEIKKILRAAQDAKTAHETYKLARQFLGAVQQRGWMPEPAPQELGEGDDPGALQIELDDESKAQEKQDGNNQQSQPKQGESGDADRSHGDADGDDQEQDSGDAASDAPSGDDAEGDASSDDAGSGEGADDDAPEGDGDGDGGGGDDAEPEDGGAGEQSDGGGSADDSGDSSQSSAGQKASPGGASGGGSESELEGDAGAGDSTDGGAAGSGASNGAGSSGSPVGSDGSTDDDAGGSAGAGGEVEALDGEEADPEADASGRDASERGTSNQLSNEEIERQARMGHADAKVASGHADELEQLQKEWEQLGEGDIREPELPAKDQNPRNNGSTPNQTSENYTDPTWDEGSTEMAQAGEQHEFFRTSSMNVGGVVILKFSQIGKNKDWSSRYLDDIKRAYKQLSQGLDTSRDNYTEFYANYNPEELEAVARGSLNSARLAFTANKIRKTTRNQKVGRLYTPTAGRKLKTGDEKVFGSKQIPDTRDYAVLLGFDVSGSTSGDCLLEIKRAVHAQAELLHRLGIKFSIYAHTAFMLREDRTRRSQDVVLLEVKDFNEPWGPEVKTRLKAVQALANNLDGHTFEVYRKLLQRQQATHRVLLYTTDGAMPAANYDEELEVLTRELQEIRRDPSYIVQAVGQGTDSPKEHGLDTVVVREPRDLALVVKALQEKLQ